MESDRMKNDGTSSADEAALAEIRALRGNQNCADCDSPSKSNYIQVVINTFKMFFCENRSWLGMYQPRNTRMY